MNSVRSKNVGLKYQRPTPSGCKDIGIRKFEFVAKAQFLFNFLENNFATCLPAQNIIVIRLHF